MTSPGISTVIGGALLPHAPQFFTLPPTEDRATVERVRAAAAAIGARLSAMRPDLWLVFANDHAEQFFLNSAPPFTIHVGGEAKGAFGGRDFHWRVPGEIGFALVRALYAQGFDPAFTSTARIDYAIGIPLTHLGLAEPVLPIYVNAYLPPQPRIERCYAFGEALQRIVTGLGLRTAVIASGGMSHFPGTERYAEPDLAFDKALLARLAQGNLRALLAYDEAALDESGNVELRCWACAAGMLGERRPEIVELEPSWHHNYASLGFFGAPIEAREPHYPATRPERVALSEALQGLAHEAGSRARYIADPAAYAAAFRISSEEEAALLSLDGKTMVALGIHPLLAFLARMAVERQRGAG
jgi:2,3-dihydroxyphenylpropionate 1,2-dioxygenase